MALPVAAAKLLPTLVKAANLVAVYDRLPKHFRERVESDVKKWAGARSLRGRLELARKTAADLECHAENEARRAQAVVFTQRVNRCETSVDLVGGLRGAQRLRQGKRVRGDLDQLFNDMLAFSVQQEAESL